MASNRQFWAVVTRLLWSLVIPAVSWAHHPIGQSETTRDGSARWIWLLGIGVFVVVFMVTWLVLSIVERRKSTGAHEAQSSRRSL